MYSSETYLETQNAPLSRLHALREKHAAFKHKIKEAQKSPSATDFYLSQLKKQKLLLKEEIEGIRAVNQRKQVS